MSDYIKKEILVRVLCEGCPYEDQCHPDDRRCFYGQAVDLAERLTDRENVAARAAEGQNNVADP